MFAPGRRLSPIGLDVGSRFIKAVQFIRARSGPRLLALACVQRSSPDQAVSPSEAAALREVLSRQGFRGRSVVLSGPPGRLLTSVMELPPRSSGAPLDQIARIELARASNCPPDSIELAWWELPAGTRAQEGTHVFALGLRHADALAALDGLEAAGFEVRALDSGILGIARACGKVGLTADSQVTGILDLGWSATTVAVLLGSSLVYQRTLPETALAALHARLIDELKIDADAADFVLRRVGLSTELPEDQRTWELLDDARAILADHFETVGSELRASLSYAARRYSATGSAGVIAAGGGAAIPGVIDRLQRLADERIRTICPGDLAAAQDEPMVGALSLDPRLTCAAGLAITPTGTPAMEVAAT